jgi:hypothetical protein
MALSENGLPRQAQEQADLADEFLATLNSGGEEDTAENGEQEEQVSDGNEEEVKQEEGASAEQEEELETGTTVAEEEVTVEDEESYRQRYETLQGKYNSEVPKLTQELKKLKEDIFARVESLQANEQPSAEEEVDDTAEFEAELEPYREQFGDELLEVINKITDRRAKQLLGEQLSPVTEKVDSVESAQIQSAQLAFTDDLTEKVDGEWEPLWKGESQEFLDFLDTKDPNGFFTYREIAKKANDHWDAEMLSKVFNTFLETQKPPVEAEAPAAKVDEKTEADRVAPSRKGVATEPQAGEAKIWTQADIEDFKTRDRQGKIPAEESEALWNDFLRAPAEGRIVD